MTPLEAAHQQLEDLESQLGASNPQLYRHLALYLQVLRDGLLNSVQQACFHVATQVHPDRYSDLDSNKRRVLHRRIRNLVQRASSMLTVEQTAHLAAQIASEHNKQRSRQRSRLLAAIGGDDSESEQSEQLEQPEETPARGSINLGMALPVGADFLNHSSFTLRSAVELAEPDRNNPGEEIEAADEQQEEADGQQDHEVTMRAMAEAFSDWLVEPSNRTPTPWEGGRLPSDPALLLAWIGGFEQALSRRLRNLSHALNVELMRLGITTTLLPVSLLDAALTAQLESLEAPANLLRLPLPFGPEPSAGRLVAIAVLLRPADLEHSLPKLHTCRTRIQQHRQEVRRMAQHYRRLRRRVQALEAEQLWLQDINPAQSLPSCPD
ncbi:MULTISPECIES: hypothetical protein [unclassified Cyanobium]|uniref:hypothetical protein n=1 Tax=unclassified Cyanobium TaxID=2627006 RepID=UPI0020CD3B0E|nr:MULTISPECIES: hypothetical protein [unclassified Cyanobium]MCP9778025.1 hypothetical protein [Cyanobium sp. Tous-M-B4]MCP9875077.1 hypothetical protein [Cyanobium sp. A2C-AMD]